MTQNKDADPLLKLVAKYRSKAEIHDVFGVVLYTEEHPYVAKVLRDGDFWKALDSKSGNRWVIFSIRPQQGHSITRMQGGGPPGTISMMRIISEWQEPSENRILLSTFEIADSGKLPLLLVFAEVKEELLRCAFRISGKTQDETYASLERAIRAATDAIKDVTPENTKNTLEIFNLIEAAADQEVTLQRLKVAASLLPYFEKIRKALQEK